jgi:hypothetical protein
MHPRTRAPRGGSGLRREPNAGQEQGASLDPRLRTLMRTQLRAGLLVCAGLVCTLGALPLVFALAPSVDKVRLFGLDLPWVLLGAAVYPVLPLVAWWYVRRVERAEREYAEPAGDR